LYDAFVAVHVAAAIVGFGATFSYPVIQLYAERRNRASIPFAMDAILAISRWVAVPATLVVGATGTYQVIDGPYGLDDPWLGAGVALYLAVMAVGVLYLAPCYRRAGLAARAGCPHDYARAMRGPRVVGPAVASAILATAVLMVVKPG